ncbi:MAG TPA: YfbR-like 5'-deoxynucleotidase, partial [Negativicutes bacterium]|nr:YfbR-like 5'-deoxynucleotidase [Negativicutes bacterium]
MFDCKQVLKPFPAWRGRKLRKTKRYVAFDVFYYRSSLWLHHLRVAALVQELAPVILGVWKDFDIVRAWTGALIHDDHELVIGDIPLFYKEEMTDGEKEALLELEMGAAESLAKKFPKTVNGYNYHELLLGAILKNTREARVVSYLDKLDAYCEASHEFAAG